MLTRHLEYKMNINQITRLINNNKNLSRRFIPIVLSGGAIFYGTNVLIINNLGNAIIKAMFI